MTHIHLTPDEFISAVKSPDVTKFLHLELQNSGDLKKVQTALLETKSFAGLYIHANHSFSSEDLNTLTSNLDSELLPQEVGIIFTAPDGSVETPLIKQFLASLEEKPGKYPKKLVLGFDNLCSLHKEPQTILEAIAQVFKSGKAPKGLTFDLSGNTPNDDQMINEAFVNLFEALAEGKSPADLELQFKSSEFSSKVFNALSKALKSGKAPKGLTIDMSKAVISEEGMKALIYGFTSVKAPEDLTIRLIEPTVSFESVDALCTALHSFSIPLSLVLELRFDRKPLKLTPSQAESIRNKVRNYGGDFYQGKKLSFEIPLSHWKDDFIDVIWGPSTAEQGLQVKSYKTKKAKQSSLTHVEKLLILCTEYSIHLEKEMIQASLLHQEKMGDPNLVIKKYVMLQNLISILQDPNADEDKMSAFIKTFKKYQPTLEQRRDNALMLFLKGIATIFTLGYAHKLGIWNVKGREMTKNVKNCLDSETSSKKI